MGRRSFRRRAWVLAASLVVGGVWAALLPLPAAANKGTENNCGPNQNQTCDNWDEEKGHYSCTFILKPSLHTTPGWSDTPCESTSKGEDDNGNNLNCGGTCETTAKPGVKKCKTTEKSLTNPNSRPCSNGEPMCWNPSKSKWEEPNGGCDAIHCTDSGGTVILGKYKPDCDSDGGSDPEPTCDPPPGDGAGQGGRRPKGGRTPPVVATFRS